MTAPYYTGDDVPLKFTVSDREGAVNPTGCKVIILTPHNSLTDETDVAVDGNEVSYNVPGSINDSDGVYKAYFILTLPSGFERTHKMEFKIIVNPEENR